MCSYLYVEVCGSSEVFEFMDNGLTGITGCKTKVKKIDFQIIHFCILCNKGY